MNIFLSISTFFHTWFYSTYAVILCLTAYFALLTWLYYVLFESSPEQASCTNILPKKVNQLLIMDLFANSQALDNIILEQNSGKEC